MKFFSKKFLGAVLMLSLPLAIGFAVAAIAQETEPATSNFKFQATWPTSPMGTDIMGEENPTLAVGIKYLYEWGVGLGGVAVFIALIMAGFEYITSIGNPSKMQDAFNRIRDAIIGLVILLSSYAVLNVVGINLKELKVGYEGPKDIGLDTLKKTCNQVNGALAPECCDIADCFANNWNCANGKCETSKNATGEIGKSCSASSDCCKKANCTAASYICQNKRCIRNNDRETCEKIIITYENNDTDEITRPNSGEEAEPQPITAKISKIERYAKDNKKCAEVGNVENAVACTDCALQLYSKRSVSDGAAGPTTTDCANPTTDVIYDNKSLGLIGTDTVCVRFTEGYAIY